MLANEHTAEAVEEQQMQIQFVRGCSARLNELITTVNDKGLKKKLERAYDIIHASPVASNTAARKYEIEVLKLIDEIEDAISDGNLDIVDKSIDMLIKNVNRRNNVVG